MAGGLSPSSLQSGGGVLTPLLLPPPLPFFCPWLSWDYGISLLMASNFRGYHNIANVLYPMVDWSAIAICWEPQGPLEQCTAEAIAEFSHQFSNELSSTAHWMSLKPLQCLTPLAARISTTTNYRIVTECFVYEHWHCHERTAERRKAKVQGEWHWCGHISI